MGARELSWNFIAYDFSFVLEVHWSNTDSEIKLIQIRLTTFDSEIEILRSGRNIGSQCFVSCTRASSTIVDTLR
jgi:hypothetical protein